MSAKKIISVVGARPNFMKVAPLVQSLHQFPNLHHKICHTGQHYDDKMSKVFFDELELPLPDFYLGISSGTITEQTAGIMTAFEKVLHNENPDCVIVVGDVTSTLACALTANRLGINVAHIEAGLRSFDRTMPEEINRILTDSISDFLFVTEPNAIQNLKNEGIPKNKIFHVGNVMIDSLAHYLPKIEKANAMRQFNVDAKNYIVVTLHRPSNVDSKIELEKIISVLNILSEKKKIIFPVHPRTRKNIESLDLLSRFSPNIILTEPIGYIDFLSLVKESALVITDSGGIQEETTFLGVQCVTARNSTERPITTEQGTNYLAGTDWNNILTIVNEILAGKNKTSTIPELWDGKSALRIMQILAKLL